jgi:hypothetical protein
MSDKVGSLVSPLLRHGWRRAAPVVAAAVSLVAVAAFLPSLPTTTTAGSQGGGNAKALVGPGGSGGSPGGPTGGPSAQSSASASASAAASAAAAAASAAAAAAAAAGSAAASNAAPTDNPSCRTYRGVTCTQIQIAYDWAQNYNECSGDQNIVPFLKALGVNPDPQGSMNVIIPYLNAHARDIWPQFASRLGSHGFYGRDLVGHAYPNDGGPFCDQVNRSSAQAMYDDGNFAEIGGCVTCSSEGSADVIQQTLAQFHMISIDNTWNTDNYYANSQTAPYAWSSLTGGDTAVRHMTDLVCHEMVGRLSSQTGDSQTANKPRVFSVVNIAEPEEHVLGDEMVQNIKACGGTVAPNPAGHEEYQKDISTAAQQAANIEFQQKSVGVTTIVCICDAIAALEGLSENTGTNWLPEYVVSDFGYLDGVPTVDAFPSAWKNAFGVAEDNAYDQSTQHWCDTAAGRAWCGAHGKATPPTDFILWYEAMKVFGTMLVLAGPDLNPQTIYNALLANCAPCPNFGDSRRYDPLAGVGPSFADGQFSTFKDYELVHWDPNHDSPYATEYKAANPAPHGTWMPLDSSIGWGRQRSWGIRTQ